jgi:hypothetical protein
MITLEFRDKHVGWQDKRFTLTVPDFPYTNEFCMDNSECRIAIAPCEFNSAANAILQFLQSLPTDALQHGMSVMKIVHDEDGVLAVWKNVLLFAYPTSYGYTMEVSALKGNVSYA